MLSRVAPWLDPIRIVYEKLYRDALNEKDTVTRNYINFFSPRFRVDSIEELNESQILKLASEAVISIWILYRYLTGNDTPRFQHAEAWFLGGARKDTFSTSSWPRPNCFVSKNDWPEAKQGFPFLLPHIFETFEKINSGLSASAIKRANGIYYTPADLAEYLSSEAINGILKNSNPEHIKIVDPSCGTGSLLLSCCNLLFKKHIQIPSQSIDNVFGIDSSPSAIQACAFTLLAFSLVESNIEISPFNFWHKIRLNLAISDATSLSAQENNVDLYSQIRMARMDIKRKLNLGEIRLPSRHLTKNNYCIWSLFPEAYPGFDGLIANPPYVKTSASLSNELSKSSNSQRKRVGPNLAAIFVEMMVHLTKPESSSSIVVPLSITYSKSPEYRKTRELFSKTPGIWRIASFDRTPDSLFGDHIKTRCSIISLRRNPKEEHSIQTTCLKRWTSTQRHFLFSDISFVTLDSRDVVKKIPKLGSELELQIYKSIDKMKQKSSRHIFGSNNVLSGDYLVPLFFKKTAYNWLPIFPESFWGNSSIPGIDSIIVSRNEIWPLFSVLSSHFAYWKWRVEGDGFHLSESFVREMQFIHSLIGDKSRSQLSELGKDLWHLVQKYPLENRNSGKRTLSFDLKKCWSLIDVIDATIAMALGLPEETGNYLSDWHFNIIVVGRKSQEALFK